MYISSHQFTSGGYDIKSTLRYMTLTDTLKISCSEFGAFFACKFAKNIPSLPIEFELHPAPTIDLFIKLAKIHKI